MLGQALRDLQCGGFDAVSLWVMARNALSRDEIEKIIASQASRSQRLRAADIVIFNAGVSREKIALDVEQIAERFGL